MVRVGVSATRLGDPPAGVGSRNYLQTHLFFDRVLNSNVFHGLGRANWWRCRAPASECASAPGSMPGPELQLALGPALLRMTLGLAPWPEPAWLWRSLSGATVGH